jgi:hypothetical protein
MASLPCELTRAGRLASSLTARRGADRAGRFSKLIPVSHFSRGREAWSFEGCRNQDFCGHLTLCSCKVSQLGPDHEVMKGPDHVEIGEAEGIVGVHDGRRDELRAGWRIATEQR